jgi:hypothetical protein
VLHSPPPHTFYEHEDRPANQSDVKRDFCADADAIVASVEQKLAKGMAFSGILIEFDTRIRKWSFYLQPGDIVPSRLRREDVGQDAKIYLVVVIFIVRYMSKLT